MKGFTESHLKEIFAHLPPAPGRIIDCEPVGYYISRAQSHPDPTINLPVVGQLLATPPVVEKMFFYELMHHLKRGIDFPVDVELVPKIKELIAEDARYSEYTLETTHVYGPSALIRMVRKADKP